MWVDLAQIRPSRLQQGVKLLSVCLLGVLVLYSGISWLIKAVAMIALLGLSVAQLHAQRRQTRLCCLQQLDRVLWQWQQHPQQKNKQKRQPAAEMRKIQARLLRVEAWLGLVVILHFEGVALGQRQTWLIWRDQVDVDNWRRLQVLQQYWSAPLTD